MNTVSVAMTTYNGESYLLPQLQSLLQQTKQPDEVIICDDCSTDASVEIIRTFIQEHNLLNWKLLLNNTNIGFIKNFRKAISVTNGEIIFLCDQDDIWMPQKIEVMSEVLEKNPHIKALASGYSFLDAYGYPLEGKQKKFYYPPIIDLSKVSRIKVGRVLYSNVAQGCTVAYRKDVVMDYCSASNCTTIAHDWALNLLAYQSKGLYFINCKLTAYRIHPNNTTGICTNCTSLYIREKWLENYVQFMEDAQLLPLNPSTQKDLVRIVKFTCDRLNWLQKRHLLTWLLYFLRNLSVVSRYFFLSYFKDLIMAIVYKDD